MDKKKTKHPIMIDFMENCLFKYIYERSIIWWLRHRTNSLRIRIASDYMCGCQCCVGARAWTMLLPFLGPVPSLAMDKSTNLFEKHVLQLLNFKIFRKAEIWQNSIFMLWEYENVDVQKFDTTISWLIRGSIFNIHWLLMYKFYSGKYSNFRRSEQSIYHPSLLSKVN